jgi:hypothetical protein
MATAGVFVVSVKLTSRPASSGVSEAAEAFQNSYPEILAMPEKWNEFLL